MDRDAIVKILIDIALALSPVVTALLGLLAVKLKALAGKKLDNETLLGALARLNDLVFTEVKAVQQLIVDDLKMANEDGILTDDEKAKIKADVLAEIKSHLGLKGIKELLAVLGLDEGTLDKFLGRKIEAAVLDMKGTSPLL